MTVGGSPFGNPRIKACWRLQRHAIAASNVLHRSCLPRHPPYALASNTPRKCMAADSSINSQTTNHHTKNDAKAIETNNEFDSNQQQKKIQTLVLLASTISSQYHAPPRHRAGTRPAPRHDGHRIAPGKKPGVAIREPKSASIPPRTHRTTGRAKPTTSSTPATPPPSHHATRGRTPSDEHPTEFSVERIDPAAPSGTATITT